MREHSTRMNVHETASIIHIQLGTGWDFWEAQHTMPISPYLLNIKTIKMTELCTSSGQSQQLLTGRRKVVARPNPSTGPILPTHIGHFDVLVCQVLEPRLMV